MRVQDFYYSLYAPLTGQGKIYSLLRYVIRNVANKHIKRCFTKKSKISDQIAKDTIVSLTTFPARIEYVWIAIESIIRQQVRPEKIILWLSAEQFGSIDTLPKQLLRQQENGLDIRLVEGDVRSHKKYAYAFKEYTNKKIILIDDDIIYKSDFVKNLVDTYDKIEVGKKVVCSYAMHMQYDDKGVLLPYKKWYCNKEYGENSDVNLFFGSGGGVIGMAKDFHPDLTNIELAVRLTPTADDVWLNTMVKLAGAKTYKIGKGLFFPIIISDDKVLYKENIGGSSNDSQLSEIMHYYHLDNYFYK